MDRAVGVGVLVAGSLLAVITALWLRARLPRPAAEALLAIAGAAIGIGGLLQLRDVGPASWAVCPLGLAAAVPFHVRFLYAGEGPFRT